MICGYVAVSFSHVACFPIAVNYGSFRCIYVSYMYACIDRYRFYFFRIIWSAKIEGLEESWLEMKLMYLEIE